MSLKKIFTFYEENVQQYIMICDLVTDAAIEALVSMLVQSDDLCFLFTEQVKKYGDNICCGRTPAEKRKFIKEIRGVKFLYNHKTKAYEIDRTPQEPDHA